MAEQVEGGDDGVVYLGRSSFKMKVGVRMTPPAGTAAAATATQAPTTPSQPPTLKPAIAVRRSSISYARTPAPPAQTPGGGRATRTMVIGGLCMIAFSCGVMCTIAVDRFWPHERGECIGTQPASGAVPSAPATPVIEAVEARVAPTPADPMPPEHAPAPAQAAPAAPTVPAAPAAPTSSTTSSAGKGGPAPASSKAGAVRGATAVRVPPTQGRVVRKRPSAAAAPVSLDTMSPTGMWVDPFAE